MSNFSVSGNAGKNDLVQSVEYQEEHDQDIDEVPQDLREIQKALVKFNNYKAVIDNGNFNGRFAKDVVELRDFINDMYKQAYSKLEAHPYYIKVMGGND